VNIETLRDQQRAEWTLCAPGWRHYRDNFTRPSRPINEMMLRRAQLRPGYRALDLACGVGNPSFDIAERVGPDGYVLGLDLVEAMVESARFWAEKLGMTNVEFQAIPNESELGVADDSFDVATCRAGLQYMPERLPAVRAVHRALKPGGRFVAMTLGCAERCMPLQLSGQVIAQHVPMPPPDAQAPGPVSLSSMDELVGLLKDAGFVDITTDTFESPIFEAQDPASAWTLFTETAGPLMPLLAAMTDQQRRAMHEDAVRVFGEAFPDGPVSPTGEVLVATGTKA
jgi:SAM-dependent methyltransferase